MRVLKHGLNDDLRKAVLMHEGIEHDEFVVKALRIDQAWMKDRKNKSNNDGKQGTKSQLQQSQCSRSYCSSGAETSGQGTQTRRYLGKKLIVSTSVVIVRSLGTYIATIRSFDPRNLRPMQASFFLSPCPIQDQ